MTLNTFPGQFNHVHVMVHPLDDGHYRITVLRKARVPPIGPVLTSTIVPTFAVGEMVRQCAINADIVCRVLHEGHLQAISNAAQRVHLARRIAEHLAGTKTTAPANATPPASAAKPATATLLSATTTPTPLSATATAATVTTTPPQATATTM